TTKTLRATQLTSCMTFLLLLPGREVDDRRQHGANEDPEQLIPIEEGNAGQRGRTRVEKRWPKHREALDKKEPIPPAPAAIFRRDQTHCEGLPNLMVHKMARFSLEHLFAAAAQHAWPVRCYMPGPGAVPTVWRQGPLCRQAAVTATHAIPSFSMRDCK